MPSERYLEPATVQALARLRGELAPWTRLASPPLEVFFPAADTPRDVRHGLGVVPTGVLVLVQIGGVVTCTAVERWTTETIQLRASANGTRARVVCVVTTQEPIDA